MKKSRVIEIFRFLGNIKINKITNKEVRSAVISNHLQMYNIAKQYEEDVKELQKRLFEGKEEEIQKLNELREKFNSETNEDVKKDLIKTITSEYKDILNLEMEFNNEASRQLNTEVELNLKKVKQDDFVETCVEADVDITGRDLISLTDLFE